jgi:hypothetical protein
MAPRPMPRRSAWRAARAAFRCAGVRRPPVRRTSGAGAPGCRDGEDGEARRAVRWWEKWAKRAWRGEVWSELEVGGRFMNSVRRDEVSGWDGMGCMRTWVLVVTAADLNEVNTAPAHDSTYVVERADFRRVGVRFVSASVVPCVDLDPEDKIGRDNCTDGGHDGVEEA